MGSDNLQISMMWNMFIEKSVSNPPVSENAEPINTPSNVLNVRAMVLFAHAVHYLSEDESLDSNSEVDLSHKSDDEDGDVHAFIHHAKFPPHKHL